VGENTKGRFPLVVFFYKLQDQLHIASLKDFRRKTSYNVALHLH